MPDEADKLSQKYAQMSDLELFEIAAKREKLSAPEDEVLFQEMRKRHLNWEQSPEPYIEREAGEVSGPLVIVRRFSMLSDAVVAKSILDSAQNRVHSCRRKDSGHGLSKSHGRGETLSAAGGF